MQADWRLQRWRSSYTPARARRCHRGGAVPPRPGPGKFALKKIHCQRRCLLLTRAAQGLGGAPQCEWHLTGGKQPIPGLARWNIVPKLLGLHRLLQFFKEYRVLEDVVLSGRDTQTRKQAAVPPEAPVPGMQQGKRFRCTCQCITPNAPPQAPRRPNGQRTWSSLRCRPLLTG